MASAEQVKELRNRTGISLMQCKTALEEAGDDVEKAIELLREKGTEIAKKKADRTLSAGTVQAYIHNTQDVGVLVELASETDFVAKNKEFVALAKEIAMHIAAADPEDVETLLKQEYIKETEKTIRDLVEGATQKFGERIEVAHFSRFSVRD